MKTATRTGRLVAEPIRSSEDMRRCREELVNRGDAPGLLLFLCGTHSTLTVDQLLVLTKAAVSLDCHTMSIKSGRGKIELFDVDVSFKLYSNHNATSDRHASDSEYALLHKYLSELPDDAPLFSRTYSSRGVREFIQELTEAVGIRPLDQQNCFSGESLRKSFGHMLAVAEYVPLADLRKMFGKLTLAETQKYLCIPDDALNPVRIYEW